MTTTTVDGGYTQLSEATMGAYLSNAALPSILDLVGQDGNTANNWSSTEIGDGNLNFVYRAQCNGKSVIVKQAVPFLRCLGEDFALSRHRMAREIDALTAQSQYAPDYVPKVYKSDKRMSLIVMEDLKEHPVLRGQLCDGTILPHIGEHLGEFLALVLFNTSVFALTTAERNKLVAASHNPELCAITEDFVFTLPFQEHESNPTNLDCKDERNKIVADQSIKTAVAEMKYKFMTEAQALIHGDLHTGSVMASKHRTHVIDAEFAFVGPMGFDIGLLIANYILAFVRHHAQQHTDYCSHLKDTINKIWVTFASRFESLWLKTKTAYWATDDECRCYQRKFMRDVLRDSAGFAGCEILRRIVGVAQVIDITTMTDATERKAAQIHGITIAKHFLTSRDSISSIDDLLAYL